MVPIGDTSSGEESLPGTSPDLGLGSDSDPQVTRAAGCPRRQPPSAWEHERPPLLRGRNRPMMPMALPRCSVGQVSATGAPVAHSPPIESKKDTKIAS
jgi:hypothetical protein